MGSQKITSNERYEIVKQFVLDSCDGSINDALDMLESINRRVCRFSKKHDNFTIIRTKTVYPNKSKNKLLVDSGKLNEKLELVEIPKKELPPKVELPSWTNGLSIRVATCLVEAKFKSIKEVSEAYNGGYIFSSVPNFGKRCLPELEAWLESIQQRGTAQL